MAKAKSGSIKVRATQRGYAPLHPGGENRLIEAGTEFEISDEVWEDGPNKGKSKHFGKTWMEKVGGGKGKTESAED